MNRIVHIVVAAGSGRRFGADLPKQFHLLGGKPVLMHAVDSMRRFGGGGLVVTVLHPDYISYWNDVCVSFGFDPGVIVAGGDTRWMSVRNALDVYGNDADIVTIHDVARRSPAARRKECGGEGDLDSAGRRCRCGSGYSFVGLFKTD